MAEVLTGMVACPEPLAAAVGAGILARGGNAVDAGVATAFAQTVANPLMASLGGCAQCLVYLANPGRVELVQASPVSGSRAVPGAYTPAGDDAIPGIVGSGRKVVGDRNLRTHAASVIPTLVRGLEVVHDRCGSMPWADLLVPAIELAREGVLVTPYLYRTWDPDRPHPMGVRPAEKIAAEPLAREIFMPDGRLLRVGERLIQRDLARTLERVGHEGARVFYDGEIGAQIGRDFEAHGGLFTTEDLRWAAPTLERPTSALYRGVTLVTDAPPGLGVILLLIMQVCEQLDLRALGWNSPAYFDVVARTMQWAFAEAATVLRTGSSDGAAALLTSARIAAVRDAVLSGAFPQPGAGAASGEGTTHLAVIDRTGNAVSWVHSSGSGSGVVTSGLGFVHNDHMIMFDPRPGRPASLAPRAVPVHGGGPVILLRDDRPFMAIGSPAGALKTTAITQVLLGVLEFGLPLQAAISAPRIHTQHEAGVVMVESSFPSGIARALGRLGHRIVVSDYTARVSAVMVGKNRDLVGGADPRGGGGLEWTTGPA